MSSIPDFENVKKWIKWLGRGLAISILIVGSVTYILWPTIEKIRVNLNALIASWWEAQPSPSLVPIPEPVEKEVCGFTDFKNSTEGWDFSLYNRGEEGFFSPRLDKKFLTPPVWFLGLIPTFFSQIELKAEVKSETDGSSSLVIFLGKKPALVTFSIADDNPQVVGFKYISITSDGHTLKPLAPAKLLKDPIKSGTPSEVTLKSTYPGGNLLDLQLTINYISAVTDQAASDSFSYSVSLPDPNPINPGGEFVNTRFGFGVYKKSSIKPISFKLCNLVNPKDAKAD